MRIAFLTDGIWPDAIGGMQKHSFYLIKYLALNDIKVDVYYAAENANVVIKNFSFDETLNIKFYKINFPKSSIKFPGHYLYSSYKFSKNIFKEFLNNQSYDFIYAQGFTSWYFCKKGVKVGSNLHGLEMFQFTKGFKHKLIQTLMRIPAKYIIKKSEISFSLGGKLTQILEQNNAKKILVTPIGIDDNWLTEPRNKNITTHFVFVGRNEWRKSVDSIYLSLKEISEFNYHFHFIGVNQPENLQSEKVSFYGEIKDPIKIKSILSKCDVLVCPSLAEGMPTVILEAMACGLAIIATDTGATSLLVNNKNGDLIEVNDAIQLKQSLLRFIEMENDELFQLKNESINLVKNQFLWSNSIKTTIQAIKSVL